MDYKLFADELAKLWNVHRTTRDRRLADRIKVVYDLDRGWKPEDVANFLMPDEKTVRLYFKTWKGKGIDGLLRTSFLSARQTYASNIIEM